MTTLTHFLYSVLSLIILGKRHTNFHIDIDMQGDVPQQRQISSGLKTYSSEYVILSSRELLVNFPLIISLFPLFIYLFVVVVVVVVVLFVHFFFGWVINFNLSVFVCSFGC